MFYKLMAALTILHFDLMDAVKDVFPFMDENYGNPGQYQESGLGRILKNARESIGGVGSVALTVLGVIMIIVGAFKIAKALMNHGKEQTSWVINILLIVLGGVMMVSGLGFFQRAGKEAQNTINGWAQ